MTRQTRRFIFYSFVVIFAVITPPTIFYAIGYSYNFQKHAIVQTGGIYLRSTPNASEITIEDKNKGTTPRLVSRLSPQTYNIIVFQNGYYPWQKTLEVAPKIVTEARNIFLFPQQIQPELVTENTTSALEDFLKTGEEKQNQIQAQKVASSTAGWLFKNGVIFYVSETDFVLYRENLNGQNKEQISKEPLPPNRYRLFTNDFYHFLALSDKGSLYYLNRENNIFKIISEEIKDAAVSGDNKKFLYWNDNEIWIYFLQDILIQPYKKADDKELITRYAQKITGVIFYPNNEYITFVVGDQIKVTELDGRDQRNTVDFIRAPNPQIYFDSQKVTYRNLDKNFQE